jgi:small-conductance mechanosensitive channel
MRQQWKRFRRMLWGAVGAVWLFCCVGILYLTTFTESFVLPMALLLMLVLTTGVGLHLMIVVYRRLKELERMIVEQRAAELQEQAKRAPGAAAAVPPTDP